MAIAITLDLGSSGVPDTTSKEAFYQGELTFSGNYVTGGDTLSFANSAILSNTAPNRVEIYEDRSTSQTATHYRSVYAKASGISTALPQLFVATNGVQLAAGAYGSLFASTIVKFRVWFGGGQ